MDGMFSDMVCKPGVLRIDGPLHQTLPLVLASPHSGREYPESFQRASRLSPADLRRSEDGFVDCIFEKAAAAGAPLIRALFPRAFVDVNREPFELDPEMFEDPLPPYVNTDSPRVTAGLGTIARIVSHGEEIYAGKLRFVDVLDRIDRFYRPYHAALRDLVDTTRQRFGTCLLLDCHSMPSSGGGGSHNPDLAIVGDKTDFVLGNCHGSACSAALLQIAHRWLAARGFSVSLNSPYAGGYTTRHYGRPREGVHALQIEINRALYMDQKTLTPAPYLTTLAEEMAAFGRMMAEAVSA